MNSVFLILALFSEAAGTIFLKLSQGFSKRLAGLAAVVLYGLSLTLLSFALDVKGFEVNLIYAAWSGVGIAVIAAIEIRWKQGKKWNGGDSSSIGSTARQVLAVWPACLLMSAQLSTGLAPPPRAHGLHALPCSVRGRARWRLDRP